MKHWHVTSSPIGDLLLVEDDGKLVEIGFMTGKRPAKPPADAQQDSAPFAQVVCQLEEYFAGKRQRFDLVLAPQGTEFQRRVWMALLDVAFGKTCSYADIATRIGSPKAVRAVGLANGRNPIPIVIPCHRVIGKDGSLTGYGGGLPIKRELLEREGVRLRRDTMALF